MYGLIYCAKNKVNGKCYIGRTKFELQIRINNHKSDSRLSRYGYLKFYRAIKKYGWNNFEWTVLQKCKTESSSRSRERYWIKKMDTKNNGYNSTDGGDGLSNPSEETRKKMAIASARTRNAIGHKIPNWLKNKLIKINTGRKMSEESKVKRLSSWNKFKKSNKYDQYVRKMSKKMKLRGTSYQKMNAKQIAKIRIMYSSGVSQYKIAKKFGLCQPTIHNIVKNKLLYSKV